MLKPELQAKFLQYLNRKKKDDEGFTLIELLVVVIIIGILAAIALPSLLGQVNKAKQSEAKNYVGSVNRAQQAYYLENQKFAPDLPTLQAGIKSQTENYTYVASGTADYALIQATFLSTKKALKNYYGVTGTITGNATTSEALTVAIACEANTPGADQATVSGYTGSCDSNYSSLSK